jgi:hypothetical protein
VALGGASLRSLDADVNAGDLLIDGSEATIDDIDAGRERGPHADPARRAV